MNLYNDIANIMRRIAEKFLIGSKISVYKSSNAVILSYINNKISKNISNTEKNQLSISFSEIEAYNGEPKEYLEKRVKLFIELELFLKGSMPGVLFISEDKDTIGVSFKKSENDENDVTRLYYDKNIFTDFIDNPKIIKNNFIDETKKRNEIIKG